MRRAASSSRPCRSSGPRTAYGTVNGTVDRGLKSCTNVDLGFSPATNTLPIRRLRLGIGSTQTSRAAWVRYPHLAVTAATQTYERLDENMDRYSRGAFSLDLLVLDEGLVASNAAWRRTGVAVGPEDTDPLDRPR